jgi:hypothetical protein
MRNDFDGAFFLQYYEHSWNRAALVRFARDCPLFACETPVMSYRWWPVAARRAQVLANEGFAADDFAGLWRSFLPRAAKVRGRNLRSPLIAYTP